MAKIIDQDLYCETIKKVINKELTQKEAALKLEITDRQVRRLVVKYKENGEKSFIHNNRGNQNAKKIPDDITSEIVNDYLTNFSDYGFTHFYEEQGYKYGISFSAMITRFTNNEIISPFAQHKTVRLYNENMKKAIRENTITETESKLYKQRKQEEFEKHIRKSSLHYLFGQEVQMDTAFWIWFGEEETTFAYLKVLMLMILAYGLPQ